MTEPIKPEALSIFVGTWKTTGATQATAGVPSAPIDATDRYEWMEGGYFLLHHIDARMPHAVKALEVIGGLQGADGGSPATSFDSEGQTSASLYRLDDRAFHIFGPTARFSGQFSEDKANLSGLWERSEDGQTWQPWMDITLTRSSTR